MGHILASPFGRQYFHISLHPEHWIAGGARRGMPCYRFGRIWTHWGMGMQAEPDAKQRMEDAIQRMMDKKNAADERAYGPSSATS